MRGDNGSERGGEDDREEGGRRAHEKILTKLRVFEVSMMSRLPPAQLCVACIHDLRSCLKHSQRLGVIFSMPRPHST